MRPFQISEVLQIMYNSGFHISLRVYLIFDDRQIKVIKNRNLSILFDERQINIYNEGEDESF